MEDDGIESECIARPPRVEVRERENGGDEQEEQEREKRQKLENGGGLLDNLLSKLASPRAPKPDCDDHHTFESNNDSADHQDEARLEIGRGRDGDEGGGSGGGGVMDKISSFFHRNNTESEGEDVKKNDDGSFEEGLKNGNDEEVEISNKLVQGSENGTTTNGGSSFISNLVPELMAPPGDEASILIHSVVHD